MAESEQSVLTGVLQVAEDAAPVEAVEAVTGTIAAALRASRVSLLIADLSGRALVRLTHQPAPDGPGRRQDEEAAEVLPFDGGPANRSSGSRAPRWCRAMAGGRCWHRSPNAARRSAFWRSTFPSSPTTR
ncbi:hypothetical protein ACN263_01670 [Micromonospora sp. WMMD729]|uniref:hypothetical protein n=1 Tax=Micromonospora sp. WMMD729 TaxID=3404127 RepID=UPI003BF55758